VPVLFLIAIVAVLVGIFFAATGRGGEMSYEPADHAPLDLGPVSAADVALLRPPTAMWGYNMQVTDEALDQIARAMRERDVTIAYLQDQLAGYEHDGSYSEPRGAHVRSASDGAETPAPWETHEISGGGGPTNPDIPAITLTPEIFGLAEIFETRDSPEAYSASPEAYSASPEAYSASPEAYGASPEAYGASPEPPGAPEPADAPESQEARQSPEDPEAFQSPEEHEPLDTPGPAEPAESPEPGTAAEPPAAAAAAAAATQVPRPPQTRLTLKASAPKPEPHEATQPSQTLQDPGEAHDATEPSAVLGDDGEESGEATQPSAAPVPDEAAGPQGAFDTHGWWAEQKEAAREEQEQGW